MSVKWPMRIDLNGRNYICTYVGSELDQRVMGDLKIMFIFGALVVNVSYVLLRSKITLKIRICGRKLLIIVLVL